jgi:ligand-binding SRPBCC domain-containing protein
MPKISIVTNIDAPIQRCFDLARSIDLHQHTSARTGEKAIAGTTTGLIKKGETVTWKAKHFGITQTLTSVITEMNPPFMFEDCMLRGAFKKIQHQHLFEEKDGKTIMVDVFEFESPLGIFGKLFNRLVLTNYMNRFLENRNQQIKMIAESDAWKKYLKQ